LILLGAWGALIPFVGPYFDFAFAPDQEWTWTTARGWLEVLPGAVTVMGGFLLLSSRNRATAMLGGWLTVLAGAWFVVGRALAGPLGIGDVGTPVAATETKRVWLELTYFYGLGALIVFLGAIALGRLSVRSVRDFEFARRPVAVGRSHRDPADGAWAAPSVGRDVRPTSYARPLDLSGPPEKQDSRPQKPTLAAGNSVSPQLNCGERLLERAAREGSAQACCRHGEGVMTATHHIF
jgi:hypothetical protein